MSNYHLVSGDDRSPGGRDRFSLNVATYLDKGWKLHGDTVVVFCPPTGYVNAYCEFFQAVKIITAQEDRDTTGEGSHEK